MEFSEQCNDSDIEVLEEFSRISLANKADTVSALTLVAAVRQVSFTGHIPQVTVAGH